MNDSDGHAVWTWLLAIFLAGTALIALAYGGIYELRGPQQGPLIWRVNRFTGWVVACYSFGVRTVVARIVKKRRLMDPWKNDAYASHSNPYHPELQRQASCLFMDGLLVLASKIHNQWI